MLQKCNHFQYESFQLSSRAATEMTDGTVERGGPKTCPNVSQKYFFLGTPQLLEHTITYSIYTTSCQKF